MFNLAADVQAHMPLRYILFTHIIASSSKPLAVPQRQAPAARYSPLPSSLFAVSRCYRGRSTFSLLRSCSPRQAAAPGERDAFPGSYRGKAPGRQWRGKASVR